MTISPYMLQFNKFDLKNSEYAVESHFHETFSISKTDSPV